MDGLIPYKDAAKRLGRHPQTILMWLRSGYLPGKKIGRSWFVAEEDLQKFLKDPPPYPRESDQ